MKTKAQLIQELYNTGHSRSICPDWLRHMLHLIDNAPH